MNNRHRSENRNVQRQNNNNADNEKKPFNKKKYREQKYSNKFKVNQWQEKRKKNLLHGLYKDLQKEERAANFGKKVNPSDQPGDTSNSTNKTPRTPFFSAKQEALRKKEAKQAQKEEFLKTKQEREQALKIYKQKKMEAFKKLSQKTRKGQPVMKGRIELLLEKIQKST